VQEVPHERTARVFTFPTTIDVDNIDARLEQGMLRIRIPKAEGAHSRVIRVQE
jgi:HSP20 family molecular chaperone IbpA